MRRMCDWLKEKRKKTWYIIIMFRIRVNGFISRVIIMLLTF